MELIGNRVCSNKWVWNCACRCECRCRFGCVGVGVDVGVDVGVGVSVVVGVGGFSVVICFLVFGADHSCDMFFFGILLCLIFLCYVVTLHLVTHVYEYSVICLLAVSQTHQKCS
jgi:hypothetical protein